jgi:BNR repeat-like domain
MRAKSAGKFLFVLGSVISLIATFTPRATANTPSGSRLPTLRTFENDQVGSVPAGCTTPTNAQPVTVSDARGFRSRQSLLVSDETTTAIAEIQCAAPAQQGAEFDFAVYPAQLQHGLIYTLLGHLTNYASGPRPVFHLEVTPTGSVRWYDNAGWTQIAPDGTVAPAAWSAVRVQVPTDQGEAYVSVNGRYIGQTGPWGVRAVADITGFQFSSAGTATAGDEVYVDDVIYGAPIGPRPRVRQQFLVGAPTTIDQSDTPMQMPNTAARVRVHGQRQILVSYPAHTDAVNTNGNIMAVSTDDGHTWRSAQNRNPLPDAPSFNLTHLANGDLLAVDYHTYMTPDSGNLQADIPEAISHDGGETWTQFMGRQTTPEPMREAAPTDWPGHPAGGFVLVHSVVQDADGTLYQSGYGFYAVDTKKYRQIMLKSTDEGRTWSTTTVAVNPTLSTSGAYQGFCEGAIERVKDGSLLIVMRTGSYQPMYTSRSIDNGATWSTPQPLLAGPDKQQFVGVYPSLTLMGNGQLVLWAGRPGQSMLTSPDGSGRTWTAPQEIDYADSANGVTLPLDARHMLAFGDRGANWSFPTPNPYSVWVRRITVADPGQWFAS